MSAPTVVVAGASGFLGSRLCMRLADAGYSVVALKRSTSDTRRLDGCAVAMFDVDTQPIDDIFRGGNVAAIVNAVANYGRDGESRGEIARANYSFPYDLLRVGVAARVGTFVNSDSVLSRTTSLYAQAKHDFVVAARKLARQGRTRFVNMRLQHLYGPGDADTKFVTHVIKTCAANALELQLTAGDQRRDFVYVDDVVDAYLVVLERRDELPEDFVEYDVGSGVAMPVRDFVELVHRLTGSRTRLRFGGVPYRPSEVMFARADTSRLAGLGWSCRTSPESGILKVIEQELVAR